MSRRGRTTGTDTYEQAESHALQRVKEVIAQANEPRDGDNRTDAPPMHELLGLVFRHHPVEGM